MLSARYVQAGDVLKNDGFKTCMDNSEIKVQRLNMEFDRGSKTITFDVAGSSSKKQNITAALVIEAYGQEFKNDFNPCDEKTKLDELCPGMYKDISSLIIFKLIHYSSRRQLCGEGNAGRPS